MGGILIGQTYSPKISPRLSFPNPARNAGSLSKAGERGDVGGSLGQRSHGGNMEWVLSKS